MSFRDARRTAKPGDVQTQYPEMIEHFKIPRHYNWSA